MTISPLARRVSVVVGCGLLGLGVWLAYGLHFNHFYEVLLLGMTLALLPLTLHVFTKSLLVRLYLFFFVAGLVGDLVMGIWLFNLWSYTYTHILEYVLLYGWVYPAGGFVMVLSYVWVTSLLDKGFWRRPRKAHAVARTRVVAAVGGVTAALLLILLALVSDLSMLLRAAGFGIVTMAAFLKLELGTIKRGRRPFTQDAFYSPKVVGWALVVTTLVNAALHEIPNVVARQGVYTYNEYPVLGVPLGIWCAWILLALIPIGVLYRLRQPAQKRSVS